MIDIFGMKRGAIIFLLLAVMGGDNASATSFLPNPLRIRQIMDVPSACLPQGDGKSIQLNRAYVMENSLWGGAAEHQWIIKLIPGSVPLTLHPGECVAFGKRISGYEQYDGLRLLDVGKTYVFVLERGDRPNERVSRNYVGAFCVMRLSDGRVAYLPYIDHPDGTTTYPACGRRIGGPPAPDGVIPPNMQ
ncbi:hypothetical protein ACFFJT_20475 [Dyella flava]|uniref:Uncharacterized protein n=1 Tax=Dyella flava TaxID=1920170 RepID=A0ABS2K0C4_9GAMM|nr:hypothetical protein [Dyella flava]MBM7124686.1 hypothetical protein [Dyella flava]GLQ49339.1 hypothetical protein GCM10010872_07880 [Dyella flava]